jgi:hypothetical protein
MIVVLCSLLLEEVIEINDCLIILQTIGFFPLIVTVDEVKIDFYLIQLERGHAIACFGSHGYSPASYTWIPLWLCWL